MEALRISGLTRSFGGVHALSDVSLAVAKGERCAIIGPNGAGKTTLFNLITGQMPATRGQISLFGQDISRLPIHRRTDLGIGRTFQKTTLFFELSVLDNVLLALAKRKYGSVNLWAHVDHDEPLVRQAKTALKEWGLLSKCDVLVRHLAYGDQRYLEIALAMALKPRLLLLDEPMAGMDAERMSIAQRIANLPKDLTVLIVEHDMDVVFSLADRIAVLHYGKLLFCGTPDECRKNQEVRSVYLGSKWGTT